jgi:hypothetical protein
MGCEKDAQVLDTRFGVKELGFEKALQTRGTCLHVVAMKGCTENVARTAMDGGLHSIIAKNSNTGRCAKALPELESASNDKNNQQNKKRPHFCTYLALQINSIATIRETQTQEPLLKHDAYESAEPGHTYARFTVFNVTSKTTIAAILAK